jgi:hypothetical protein
MDLCTWEISKCRMQMIARRVVIDAGIVVLRCTRVQERELSIIEAAATSESKPKDGSRENQF